MSCSVSGTAGTSSSLSNDQSTDNPEGEKINLGFLCELKKLENKVIPFIADNCQPVFTGNLKTLLYISMVKIFDCEYETPTSSEILYSPPFSHTASKIIEEPGSSVEQSLKIIITVLIGYEQHVIISN